MTTQLELADLKRAWIDDAADYIVRHFPAGRELTAETIHKIYRPAPHPNWYGCLLAKLRCMGRVKEVGRVKSLRPERNGAKVTLWQTV